MTVASRLTAVLAVAGILTLAGCTGGTETTAPTPSATTTPSDYVDITDQPGSGDDFVGALEDTEVTGCAADGDEWKVTGTVTNPADDAQSYRIYVSLLDGTDTLGVSQVDVDDVAAGESTDWSATLPVSGDDLDCVLRVERFDA